MIKKNNSYSYPRFELAFEIVLGHEGGFQNMYADRGNWTSGRVGVGERKGTNWGITAMSYPHLDIRALTEEDAKKIYWEDFWQPVMSTLPHGVALEAFDAQVNTGRGIRFLQMAVGTLADGIWGPISRRALRDTIAKNGPVHVIKEQVAFRMTHYALLDDLDDKFALGWMRRGVDLLLRAVEFSEMEHLVEVPR